MSFQAHVDDIAEAEGIAELKMAAHGLAPYWIPAHVRLGMLVQCARELGQRKPISVAYNRVAAVAAHVRMVEAYRLGKVYRSTSNWSWLDHSSDARRASKVARQRTIIRQLKAIKFLPGSKVVGTDEASALLGIGPDSISKAARRGRLEATCVIAQDERRTKGGGARWCWTCTINALRDMLSRSLNPKRKSRSKGWASTEHTPFGRLVTQSPD